MVMRSLSAEQKKKWNDLTDELIAAEKGFEDGKEEIAAAVRTLIAERVAGLVRRVQEAVNNVETFRHEIVDELSVHADKQDEEQGWNDPDEADIHEGWIGEWQSVPTAKSLYGAGVREVWEMIAEEFEDDKEWWESVTGPEAPERAEDDDSPDLLVLADGIDMDAVGELIKVMPLVSLDTDDVDLGDGDDSDEDEDEDDEEESDDDEDPDLSNN